MLEEDHGAPSGFTEEAPPTQACWRDGASLLSGEADAGRRTWLSDFNEPVLVATEEATSTRSWLSGLVKEEKRPAINDIARLIFGSSAPSPTPSVLSPGDEAAVSGGEVNVLGPNVDADPFARSETVEPPLPAQKVPAETSEPPMVEERTILPRGLQDLPPPVVVSITSVPLAKPEIVKSRPKPAKVSEQKSAPVHTESKLGSIPHRDRVSFYRALSAMFESGVPLFAIFEFLAREGENGHLASASRRVGQNLVAGWSLSAAVSQEPQLFDIKAVRMLEVGYRSGKLDQILAQLADDEEHAWRLKQNLKSQLTYPLGIALLTLIAVVLLPPLVLTDLLQQVVSLTSEPPLLTRWLLSFSAFLGSPWTLLGLAGVVAAVVYGLRTTRGRELLDNLELAVWFVPALGQLWRNMVGLRFMRVFSMTYKAGLPAVLGLELSASATGSQLAYRVFPLMKSTLMDGGSLAESFSAGGFLPTLALEAVSAGELAGKVPVMLESASEILEAEVQSRVDAVAKLVEPIVLACLGIVVGVFVLGCLLPIVELTSTL